jgi:hypothetical protein
VAKAFEFIMMSASLNESRIFDEGVYGGNFRISNLPIDEDRAGRFVSPISGLSLRRWKWNSICLVGGDWKQPAGAAGKEVWWTRWRLGRVGDTGCRRRARRLMLKLSTH